MSQSFKAKRHPKASRAAKHQRRDAEAREVAEAERRIAAEAPPAGTNPLATDLHPPQQQQPRHGGKRRAESSGGSGSLASASSTAPSSPPGPSSSSSAVVYSGVRQFAELPLSGRTQRALADKGFIRLTDIQRAAIPHALAGRDILGAARTGSGKTLAFLIPMLEKLWRSGWSRSDGIGGIVISPTRELALQIFDVLRSIGPHHDLSAGLIIGGKSVEEERARINNMNILVCTPGRLLQHMDQTYGFDCSNLQALVLDEADRILDMGFRQTMSDIVANLPASRQTMLFSATQTRSVRDLARLSLSSPEYLAVHDQDALSTPERLEQHYMEVAAHGKFDLLFSFIKSHLRCKTLVFVSACKQVRFLYEMFRRVRPGVPLLHLHGKMSQAKRMALYYQFCEKADVLMFATDVAARGLDFPDVDWIVQMDAPESVATYIHRVGRTARYRAGGKALLLALPSELPLLAKLQAAKVNVARVNANPAQLKSVSAAFQSFLAEDNDLKFLAQKALLAYLKSVYLQPDKAVFDLSRIDVHALALAMGLQAAPKLTIRLSRAGLKDKNVPYQLRELMAAKAGSAATRRQKAAAGDERGMAEMDRLLRRRSQGPLSEQRMRMAAGELADDDDDDVLVVKRRHAADEDEDEDQPASRTTQPAPRVEEQCDQAAQGGGSSSSWIDLAVQQLAEEDVADKQRERDRIHEKHQLRRRKERAYNSKKQGPADSGGDVQLAAVADGADELGAHEERAAEGDGGDSSSADDDSEIPLRGRAARQDGQADRPREVDSSEGEGEGEDPSEDKDGGESASQPARGKRKQQVGRRAAAAAAQSSAKRTKRARAISSLPLAEQEAMALRSLQS